MQSGGFQCAMKLPFDFMILIFFVSLYFGINVFHIF